MKKMFVLLAMFCLCFQAAPVFAATSDFSGYWELDAGKSILPDTMQVESIVLRVSHTEKDLKVESTTLINANSSAAVRGKFGVVKQTEIYNLEGGETKLAVGGEVPLGNETRKASVTADGKLNLTLTRNVKNAAGEATMKTNEIWELLDAGETLKITRYMETPRGATNAELFFTKKSAGVRTAIGSTAVFGTTQAPVMTGSEVGARQISGGVLNGKATRLPKPEYPAAARAVRASGAVNVQVTINEQGNIISASAVSGHPLLRQAAEQAARDAQFAPTLLEGVPVSVTGVIVYNFVP